MAWAVLILALLYVFFAYLPAPPYSPDSWNYYELAESIFKDFYRVKFIRSFEGESSHVN